MGGHESNVDAGLSVLESLTFAHAGNLKEEQFDLTLKDVKCGHACRFSAVKTKFLFVFEIAGEKFFEKRR